MPRVRVGIFLPPFGELADPRLLADLAAESEAAGFDGVFLWDHIMRAGTDLPAADPWIALAAMAAATETVRLGPIVTPLARRRPQKVARESVTLDHLSKGRLVLGVGLGVNTGGELTRFGEEEDDRTRGDRLDEALEVVCRLWSGETVHHEGRFYRADGVRFLPRPVQSPRIPIWVAGRGNLRPLRRAARYDGICPETTPDGLDRMLDVITCERGSLDGFDVAIQGKPGCDPAPWEEHGATWWLMDFPEVTSAASVRAVIRRGPPL